MNFCRFINCKLFVGDIISMLPFVEIKEVIFESMVICSYRSAFEALAGMISMQLPVPGLKVLSPPVPGGQLC